MLGAPELRDMPAPLACRLEALLAAAPLPADGGDPARRRHAEQQVQTLTVVFAHRQALRHAQDSRRGADDGLLPASPERHRQLDDTARTMRGLLDIEMACAVLHADRGACAPEDVALAAGVPSDEVLRAAADYSPRTSPRRETALARPPAQRPPRPKSAKRG